VHNQIPVNRWEPRAKIKALAHTDLTKGLVLWHRLITAGHKQKFFVKEKERGLHVKRIPSMNNPIM